MRKLSDWTHRQNRVLDVTMAAALAGLTQYGSDSDEDTAQETATSGSASSGVRVLSLPMPQHTGTSSSIASAPHAKRPRRAFQLPLPAPRHGATVKSDGESSDDEDAKRFAANRKGGGLLASVSTLCNSLLSCGLFPQRLHQTLNSFSSSSCV